MSSSSFCGSRIFLRHFSFFVHFTFLPFFHFLNECDLSYIFGMKNDSVTISSFIYQHFSFKWDMTWSNFVCNLKNERITPEKRNESHIENKVLYQFVFAFVRTHEDWRCLWMAKWKVITMVWQHILFVIKSKMLQLGRRENRQF